jgi:hypothetical protein
VFRGRGVGGAASSLRSARRRVEGSPRAVRTHPDVLGVQGVAMEGVEGEDVPQLLRGARERALGGRGGCVREERGVSTRPRRQLFMRGRVADAPAAKESTADAPPRCWPRPFFAESSGRRANENVGFSKWAETKKHQIVLSHYRTPLSPPVVPPCWCSNRIPVPRERAGRVGAFLRSVAAFYTPLRSAEQFFGDGGSAWVP